MIDKGALKSFVLSQYCPMVLAMLDGLVAKAETDLVGQSPADFEAVRAFHSIAFARATMLAEFKHMLRVEQEVKESKPLTPEEMTPEIILKSIQGV